MVETSRTCVLHIGMHKTGTSSVQDTLHGYDDGHSLYCKFDRPNHSVPMITLFKKKPEEFRVHRQMGRSARQVETLRKRFEQQLKASITKTSGQLVISAEGLGQQLTAEEVADVVAYFRARFDRVQVIAYLRSFEDYAASAFQEHLKSGAAKLFIPAPDFRGRFEPWLEALEPGEIEFVPYQGDTVTDFCRRTGLKQPEAKAPQSNISLSGPAMGLLFFYNENAKKPLFGSEERVQNYNRMLAYLQGIKGEKFTFSQSFLAQQAEKNAEDIAWMEAASGLSLRSAKAEGPHPVGTVQNMRRIAHQSRSLLSQDSPEGQKILRLLEGDKRQKGGKLTQGSGIRSFPLFARPNLTLLDDYIVRTVVPPKAREVVVSFEAADPTIPRNNLRRAGFGEDFLLAKGYAVVSVLTGSANWFRDGEIQDFLARPRFQAFLKGFDHVQCYGSSMGGYGACAFADLLGADNIVALQPVSTLRHDLVPWEERFQAKHTLDWTPESAYSDAVEGAVSCPSIYAFYDPQDEDAQHAKRLTARLGNQRVHDIQVPGAKHAVPRYLARHGLLKPVVLMALRRRKAEAIRARIDAALLSNVSDQ